MRAPRERPITLEAVDVVNAHEAVRTARRCLEKALAALDLSTIEGNEGDRQRERCRRELVEAVEHVQLVEGGAYLPIGRARRAMKRPPRAPTPPAPEALQ